MNSTTLELALKKQRLQIANEGLRAEFGTCARGLVPVFNGADFVAAGARWVRRNPGLVVATTVALVVARPKGAWRWARRAFIGWQAWRQIKDFLERSGAS